MAVNYICFLIIFLYYGANGSNLDNLNINRNSRQHPAADFHTHQIVKPKIFHGREKRQVATTKDEETGEHFDHVEIIVDVDGQNFTLDLTINKQLIPRGYFQRHQENGKLVIHKPTKDEIELCHYVGKVRDREYSWAAISTCNRTLSGAFYDGKEMHYVERDENGQDVVLEKPTEMEIKHYIYKHSDLIPNENITCGYAGHTNEYPSDIPRRAKPNRMLRYKRSLENKETIRGPYNANKESKYVELVLVIDNREFKEFNENRAKVINHSKTIANIINGLYSPLNIFVALVGVVIWSEQNEMEFSPNGDSTLTNFLHYRKEKLLPIHPNDNAQLLTKYNFDHGVVGKALKGPMCTYEYSGGVNTDHSPVVGLVATTIAHEMGHNFGMEHDTTECDCPDERCIMAPSSSTVAPTHWSSCSLNSLLRAFIHGMDYCLKNKPEFLFDGPVCGNGFVEPGEQCDCGLPEHCHDNPCCNPLTCTLYQNASCATGECCDLQTCKPKNAGSLCRSADYECDLPEYCTGQSEYCPPDIYKMDTESCDGGRAFCYHGFCRTRTDQCQLLWGETGASSDDQCYEMNIKGNRHGNCGYNKFNKSYFKCESESVLCGMLHCRHLNERLEFGMESVAVLSHSFINKKGSIIPCRTAIVDLGTNQIDPGLTPDGAKCGDGKMCVNQRCVDVMSLRKQTPTSCPNDCNGNGWCNNKGHCHCKEGYSPPHCEYPGPGGSEDSGPATDPNARQKVVVIMFILFLGVIPTIVILILLVYYTRNNMKFTWKKTASSSPVTSKSPNKSRGPPFASGESGAKRTAEDNHSLLQNESSPGAGLTNEFFGSFKGFSLKPAVPLKKKEESVEPIRSAPPPPPPPAAAAAAVGQWTISQNSTTTDPSGSGMSNYQKPPPPVPKSGLFSKPVQKMNSFRNSLLLNGIKNTNTTAIVPALPPPNPGSTARPIISSPVLESSTSNAKELVSPLRRAPKVPFKDASPSKETIPKVHTESVPTNIVSNTVIDVSIELNNKKPLKEKESTTVGSTTLNRIASFLKPADKKPNVVTATSTSGTLPRNNQIKAQKILDKQTLRSLEISNPVPQTAIDISISAMPVDAAAAAAAAAETASKKNQVVMRAQSMRSTKPKDRPNIPNFGSMRHPGGYKRPMSIPAATRPKSPPPPRPPVGEDKTKKSSSSSNQYDDCLNKQMTLSRLSEESPTVDNIYAVIDESPMTPELQVANSSSIDTNDSMGLLGEIVSEIQNRNLESIYSTSTLKRKKNDNDLCPSSGQEKINKGVEYANTLSATDNEYSNMDSFKSGASSTASSSCGYIVPSAVNVPVSKAVEVKEKESKPPPVVLSTFRSDGKSTKTTGTATVNKSIVPSATKKLNTVGDGQSKPPIVNKQPTTPTNKNTSVNRPSTSPVSSTMTPSSLKSRKASPTRPPPQLSTPIAASRSSSTNRSVTNSPDLVTSCNSSTNSSKGPDVLNSNSNNNNNNSSLIKKPSVSSAKPSLLNNTQKSTALKNNSSKTMTVATGKSAQEKKTGSSSFNGIGGSNAGKPTTVLNKSNSDISGGETNKKTVSIGVRKEARSNSNVASLQQKFEEKNNGKTAPKIK